MAGHEINESWTELYHRSQEGVTKLLSIESQFGELKNRHALQRNALARQRNALAEIIRAADGNSHPIPYEVRAAIERARRVLSED